MDEEKSPSNKIPGHYVDSSTIRAGGGTGPNATYNTPSVADIGPATPATPDTQLAREEARKEETETRGARLTSNLLEQKHSLIEIFTSIVGFVIISLYLTFLVTIWYLFASRLAFTGNLPVTAVILVGLTGSIPTILSIFVLVGLLSNKDGSKDKEEKSPISELGSAAKFVAEVMKHTKHL